ncbi:kunitz-type serine protease inhibitor spermatin [Haematobia irritans]|uniref:kunitz-type serine protease inhibitor spermatin n=1 Tax=Haematobia irritans TaxID=7368 RepID=UPI003F50263A
MMTKFLNSVLLITLISLFVLSTESRWTIPNICLQPPPRSEGGVCNLEIEGYFFDPQMSNCEKYSIAGCRLSGGQSFGSHEDCVATCIHGTRRLQDIRHD